MKKALFLFPLFALLLALSAPSASAAIPEATCFWFGPMGKQYPESNKAYPEESARYWGARFRLPAGSTLLLRGRYPHARFVSLNAYLDKGATDAINDFEIRPDRGSVNPYRVGANRYATKRSYTIRVSASGNGTNGLALPAEGNKVQELIWRVYLPDRARDMAAAALPAPSLRLASGRVLSGRAACSRINDQQRFFTLQTMPEGIYTALVNTSGADPDINPARDPLRWEKYFNLPLALSVFKYGTPSESGRLQDKALGEVGSNYDNKAVKYMTGPINAAFGDVLLLEGKLPTTPRSGPAVKRMAGGEMRYWSLCSNSSPVETRAIDCVYDKEIQTNTNGSYKIVVSALVNRPANAIAACGYTWLDWGSEPDILGRSSATLVMRNLLPASSFAHSIQKISIEQLAAVSSENDHQADTLGPYMPSGSYYESKAAFESLGCSA